MHPLAAIDIHIIYGHLEGERRDLLEKSLVANPENGTNDFSTIDVRRCF
jgi:hypothetical protein